MGTIGFDSTSHYYFAIVNAGDDSLSVYSITSSNPAFALSKSASSLGAKSYEYVRASYTSGSVEASDSAVISITSNDADESLIEVPVTVHVTDLAGVAREDGAPGFPMLAQNSPNPFVGRTTIAFSLAVASGVDLSVYNTEGRLVTRLLQGDEVTPGEHQVVFDSGALPSGVYYYRLRAGDRVETKRMVLIR
jgi:hypothetical protein